LPIFQIRLMRTFIAIELSETVQQALAAVQQQMRPLVSFARWTRPDGTHLTLKFLGEAQKYQLDKIETELDRIASAFGPFELALNSVGAFPRLAAPRVLWVGINQGEAVKRLQSDIESAISPLGFPSEKRDFKPHLTLARLEGANWPLELRQRFLDCASIISGVQWHIDRMILFRSELSKGGAVYTALHISGFSQSA